MHHLSIRLLGPFQVAVGSEPVTDFKSDKVRALLAFLAVESQRPHSREILAGLLWPEFPERSARVNLRDALANLRHMIGDRNPTVSAPYLHVSWQTIQFNSSSDAWVDARAFTERVKLAAPRREAIQRVEEVIELYRGSFLEGFSLADSPAFEEWALLTRERFHRLMMEGLRQLSAYYEESGEHGVALGHARRMLELDPLVEAAHRQVMRLLILNGERGAALAQYEACRRVLAQEMDITPSRETTNLYQQIRQGKLEIAPALSVRKRELPVRPPSFLEEGAATQFKRPVFVGREREMARLGTCLEQAVGRQGRVAFVVGGPGRGKTALLEQFAWRAMAAHPDLLVAGGNGNAYSGVGDPYLPFREVLDMLAGDVETRWAGGAIDRDHARRLWRALPLTAQALVERGPDLIDTLLPGRALLDRAVVRQGAEDSDAPWRARLEELVARKAAFPPDPNLQQSALFKQYARVLTVVARQQPLLLLLDDLQWADAGSIGLLFHLGRELSGCRIVILGAYRPEDVALGRPSSSSGQQERHPLEGVLAEFRRRYGDVWLDLGRTEAREGRRFVAALVDSQANRLDERFRDTLYRHTEGHPLFTAELLRVMQERGNLVQDADADGAWVEGPALDWETLPAKVEGVIAGRLNRLGGELRQILTVACVEGETFTAQVVARVLKADERRVLQQLSGPLEVQHRLVSGQGVRRLDGLRLSLHRFRHNLYQRYLYNHLNELERAYLHEDVGNALEALYANYPHELAANAPHLARHFQEAGNTDKSIDYLHQAGVRATQMSANEEAAAHFSRALQLLETLSDSPARTEKELMLQVGLAVPLLVSRGWATPEMTRVVTRMQELCEQVGETPQLFPVLWFTYTFHAAQGNCQRALELAEQLWTLAEQSGDPGLIVAGQYALASILSQMGELTSALTHAERVIGLYDPIYHHALTYRIVGHDPGAQCLETSAMTLWSLGYPDEARRHVRRAVALAEELAHPYTLALAHQVDGIIHAYCRNWQVARECTEKARSVSREHGLFVSGALAATVCGLALVKLGQASQGIEMLRRGIADLQGLGTQVYWSLYLSMLADGYIEAGRTEEALGTLKEALTWLAETQECNAGAEIYRLHGELLQRQGGGAQAETQIQKAIEIAQRQQARSLELRAKTSLARLWQKQGKVEPAREMLAEVFGWFTEGFDTADLQDAQALLKQLAGD